MIRESDLINPDRIVEGDRLTQREAEETLRQAYGPSESERIYGRGSGRVCSVPGMNENKLIGPNCEFID